MRPVDDKPSLPVADLAVARDAGGARGPVPGSDVVSAAEQFEGIMIHELMKAMRATVPGEDQGFAMETAHGMFDQALADSAAGGLGLAPMIARDLGATPEQLMSMRGSRGRVGGDVMRTRGLDAYRAAAPRPLDAKPQGVGATTSYVGPRRDRPTAGVVGLGAPQAGLDPVEGIVSSEYGWRTHPITGTRKFHEGLDIAAPEGTEIRAIEAGTVVYAGRRGGYGKTVELRHDDGTLTRYAHASRIHVRRGDRIEVGEAVADVGQTGHATGPHLHFEVRRDGKPVDPQRHLERLRGRR